MNRPFHNPKPKNTETLECEKPRVFFLLMFLGGFYGGFTYVVRGGVFSNAQTANFVLCAIAIAGADWRKVIYYLIPMAAYLLGIIASEVIAPPAKKCFKIRWETILIGVEIIIVLILGLIPDRAPYQISQIIVNFMAAMQWNTFRQTAGISVATTFVTNHWRQVGIQFSQKLTSHGKQGSFVKLGMHIGFIVVFMLGVSASTILCRRFSGRGIWFTLIPLVYLFCDLLYADRVREADKLSVRPHGH